MTWLRVLMARLLGRIHRDQSDEEFDDELRFHLQMETDANVRRGMTPAQARRAARLRLGGIEGVREEYRDVRGLPFVETCLQDLRYSVRGLAKSRGFTAVAVFSLALGIGVNTAVFSVVDAMLFRPFSYDDPDRLVLVNRLNLRRPDRRPLGVFPTVADYVAWKPHADVFEEMAIHMVGRPVDVASDGYPTERLQGASVSTNLFTTLGVEPHRGRAFLPADGKLGSEAVVILSHALWERRFGADATVIGETLWLDRTAATIIGVMPVGFAYDIFEEQFWVPARFTPADDGRRVGVPARLAPSVSMEQAQAAMDTLAAQRATAFPETNDGWGARLVPLHEWLTGHLRPRLFVLWGAVGFVLLVACANTAGVMLARASARTKEVATRLALGASRWRVARLFLAEGLLVALASGVLGSFLAFGAVPIIKVFNPDASGLNRAVFPRLQDASVDGRVLGYTLVVSLLTALLFSVAPALIGSRPDLTRALKDTGRGITSGALKLRLRAALVVAQVALALVLVTGAGLMVNTMRNLTAVDPGFDAEQLLTFRLPLSQDRYLQDASVVDVPRTRLSPRVDAFHARVLRRLRTLPGVESAAGITLLPLSHVSEYRVTAIDGRPEPPADADRPWQERPHRPAYRAVMGDFFDVTGIPLLRGRAFTAGDVAEAPWVVVISRGLADMNWPNMDPVGRQLTVMRGTFGEPAPGERPRTVVGVVEDVRHASLQEEPFPTMYVPHAQQSLSYYFDGRTRMSYVVRTSADPMSLAPVVQRLVAAVDPDQAVAGVLPMTTLFSIWTGVPRFYTLLTLVFAAVTLMLSVVGIYGVMAYGVTRRTHEIGVRMALGAARGQVVRLVVGSGLALGAGGVALGLVGAFWLTRLMGMAQIETYASSSVLYGVSATDPATFAVGSALLVAAVLLACYGPARIATKVDPMTALRHE